jgi:hypothetical protein
MRVLFLSFPICLYKQAMAVCNSVVPNNSVPLLVVHKQQADLKAERDLELLSCASEELFEKGPIS